MQNEAAMVSDLTKALTRAGHNQTALRLLVEMQPRVDIIATLLPGIMDLAIDSSNLNSIGLARAVLYHYKNESWIRSNIQTSTKTYLAENDEWHYRRIAELYESLNYEKELTSFLSLCKANANLEIQEIAEDFNRAQE